MLLAVEGGGFFSSSAPGYSKGLTLLLLGQKNEDRPMRVAPWNNNNQYQLVDQEPDPHLQLASLKNRFSHGCASFICLGRASAGLDSPSHLKVGPAQHQDISPGSLVSDKGKDRASDVDDKGKDAQKLSLKSSLKRPSVTVSVPVESVKEHETSSEKGSDVAGNMERRKVRWTDACGSELAEVREFEPSELGGSDDELENIRERTCSCTIM